MTPARSASAGVASAPAVLTYVAASSTLDGRCRNLPRCVVNNPTGSPSDASSSGPGARDTMSRRSLAVAVRSATVGRSRARCADALLAATSPAEGSATAPGAGPRPAPALADVDAIAPLVPTGPRSARSL